MVTYLIVLRGKNTYGSFLVNSFFIHCGRVRFDASSIYNINLVFKVVFRKERLKQTPPQYGLYDALKNREVK